MNGAESPSIRPEDGPVDGVTARSTGGGFPVSPTADATWRLVEEGFDLAREHEVESLFAISNGYMGTRGSLAEGSSVSSPATFIAGIFDRSANAGSVPEIVATPDWLRLRGTIDGHEIRLENDAALEHRRVLDLRQGILWREWRHRDANGRVIRLRGLRLASLADRHAFLQSVELGLENFSGRLRVESWIERPDPGREPATAPAELAPVVLPANAAAAGSRAFTVELRSRTTAHAVVFAAASTLEAEAAEAHRRTVEIVEGEPIERWEIDANIGTTHRLNRIVAVYTSRDSDSPAQTAKAHADRLLARGVDRILADHVTAWKDRKSVV